MASKKISELAAKTTLADADLIPIVDSEASPIETKKITVANAKTQLTADAVDALGGIMLSSGSLSSGPAGAIAFAKQIPGAADRFVTKVVIDVTTAGGTAGAVLKVGLADNSSGTNLGSEFFTGLDLNSTDNYDSWDTDDTGAQTKFVTWKSTGADDYIVGRITSQNASSLAGKYYIFSVPK